MSGTDVVILVLCGVAALGAIALIVLAERTGPK